MRRLLTAAVVAATALPGIASAAEPPCLTAAEFAALSSYGLPSIIKGTARRCAATLPSEAYLRRNGTELAERYAVSRPAAWPGARAAFLKLSAGSDSQVGEAMRNLPDATLQPMVDGLIEGMVEQRVPADRCGAIDRVVRLLSPLPPESTAELIAIAAGLGSRTGQARVGSFSLCRA